MATPNPSPGNNPQPNTPKSAKQESRQRIIAIAAVIILILLAVNAFLLINYLKKGKENTQLVAQVDETEQLRAELEKQYYQAMSDLEEQRGRNEELNALIDQQKEELKAQKERIEGMLGDRNRLNQARQEIKKLNAQVEQYLAEINQLRAENQELAATNEQLQETKVQLESSLASQQQVNEELSEAKASLMSEKESLEKTKEELSKKVTKASVIRVMDIEAEGQKVRSNGKTSSRKAAKNVEQLQVCFQTTANEVVDPGLEQFLIRIVGPNGETLAQDQLGSGVFHNRVSGQQMRFTQMAQQDYNREGKELCIVWSPNQPFQEGNYEIEIYNKGYLAGVKTFLLR